MINSVFILSTGARSGKSLVSIGLINLLLTRVQKVGYFKPIINSRRNSPADTDICAIKDYFRLGAGYDDMFACDWSVVYRQFGAEQQGNVLDEIISKFKALEKNYDFTVIEGSDYTGDGSAFEFDTNIQIAKNLSAPAILVISGDKSADEISSNTEAAFNKLKENDVPVLAVFVNKVKPGQDDIIKAGLSAILPGAVFLSLLPGDNHLQSPTIDEISRAVDAKTITGANDSGSLVENITMGAAQIPAFLSKLTEKTLVITPGDRDDILISALQASLSGSFPKLSGILLTDGLLPDQPVLTMINGLQSDTPVLSTHCDIPSAMAAIRFINPSITSGNFNRIDTAISLFNRASDLSALNQMLVTNVSCGLTPHMFQFRLIGQAKKFKAHIVMPEGADERVLKAVAKLISLDLVRITLFGEPATIRNIVKKLGIDLDIEKIGIVNPLTDPCFEEYANELFQLRKDKMVTLDMARDLMRDPSYFATMMVYKGRVDGMVSGAVNTTQQTIRPALQFIKTKPGKTLVSSVFFMCLADRVVVFGDCAVNPDPTAEELAEIAISSAETSSHFGIEPRIAMLSYSSGNSGMGKEVEKVRTATEIVRQKRPDLKIDGPMQYDAAVDPVVGQSKLPGSDVAGHATVFIFPDLNTGNNIYKAVQRETGALAIGPVLQDLKKPVNDLSRGCTPDDVFNTVIVTAIQCFQNKTIGTEAIHSGEMTCC